jgi:hypothetical protein
MERMPEAEVSLRLAFWLVERDFAGEGIEVAIDGAQVRTGENVHFNLVDFLRAAGWAKECSSEEWQSTYKREGSAVALKVHANPGKGDVVARLRSGFTLRAECKKGPLSQSRRSEEYPLIREALGQLLTVEEVGDKDILAVAVPHTEKFAELALRWRKAPLVKRLGVRILTVARAGNVDGFDEEPAVE